MLILARPEDHLELHASFFESSWNRRPTPTSIIKMGISLGGIDLVSSMKITEIPMRSTLLCQGFHVPVSLHLFLKKFNVSKAS